MKIIIFDVGNANCALAVCANGNSTMIDCGSHSEKEDPLDVISRNRKQNSWLGHMKNYVTRQGISYPLTQLAISHADDDHIRNAKNIYSSMTPYLLRRRRLEYYPEGVIDHSAESLKQYKQNFCDKYRGTNPEMPNWAYSLKEFSIPTHTLQNAGIFAFSKIINNASYVFLLEYAGFRILFGGDMEKEGWEWLLASDSSFVTSITSGIDIFVASHHGHRSGYSEKLINTIGKAKLAILSKASETEESVVDSRYSQDCDGLIVKALNSSEVKKCNSLSTRNNGHIYISVANDGPSSLWVDHH